MSVLPGLQLPPTLLIGGGREFEHLGTWSNPNNQSSYSIANVNFGRPSPDRLIVAAVASGASTIRYILSASIGGVPATTAVHDTVGTNSNNATVSIIYAVVPEGQSGSIDIQYGVFNPENVYGVLLNVVRAKGMSSTEPHNAIAGELSGSVRSANLEIPKGGFAVGAGTHAGDMPWTGLIERADLSDSRYMTVADTGGIVPVDETRFVSLGNQGGHGRVVFASWG